jgi:hypothetical protein
MISKTILQSVIKKYHLGEIEQVKWEIEDNKLSIDFVAPSKIVLGKVTCENFPLEDVDLAIYNTKKLDSLVGITSGDLLLEVEKQKEILLKLKISDENYNLTYALSDPLLVPKAGKVKPIDSWNIDVQLEPEDVLNLLKAKNALSEIDNMLITTSRNLDDIAVCEFIFGDEQGHNNKITYQMNGTINKENIKIKYNSNMFKTILNANRDAVIGKLQLSKEGLMRLEFENEAVKSEYYMVPQEGGIIS